MTVLSGQRHAPHRPLKRLVRADKVGGGGGRNAPAGEEGEGECGCAGIEGCGVFVCAWVVVGGGERQQASQREKWWGGGGVGVGAWGSHVTHAVGRTDREMKRCQSEVPDYIEFPRTNHVVKFHHLRLSAAAAISLTPPPPTSPQPRGEAERTCCNMISLHKDVSGV